MKKPAIALLFTFIIASAGFTQVLKTKGVENTLWTGMGVPTGTQILQKEILSDGMALSILFRYVLISVNLQLMVCWHGVL